MTICRLQHVAICFFIGRSQPKMATGKLTFDRRAEVKTFHSFARAELFRHREAGIPRVEVEAGHEVAPAVCSCTKKIQTSSLYIIITSGCDGCPAFFGMISMDFWPFELRNRSIRGKPVNRASGETWPQEQPRADRCLFFYRKLIHCLLDPGKWEPPDFFVKKFSLRSWLSSVMMPTTPSHLALAQNPGVKKLGSW